MEKDLQNRLDDAKKWLQNEYSGIRTGQANPSLLDSVRVDSYGAMVPLNQVGNVSTEDARTLRVSLWDASQVASVERAITDADLGVSVATDSSGLRVIFPELTSERREQLLRLAKSKLEDARVTVRAIRDDEMKDIDKKEKDGDISEDERFQARERVQENVEATNKVLDQLYQQKESELNK